MSEWTGEDQDTLEFNIEKLMGECGAPTSADRALACVRLCAGHADLAKCEVNPVGTLQSWRNVAGERLEELATLREQLSEALKSLDDLSFHVFGNIYLCSRDERLRLAHNAAHDILVKHGRAKA